MPCRSSILSASDVGPPNNDTSQVYKHSSYEHYSKWIRYTATSAEADDIGNSFSDDIGFILYSDSYMTKG